LLTYGSKNFLKNIPIFRDWRRIASVSELFTGILAMAYHVPFDQRHSTTHSGPVYIGFDVPAPAPRPAFNWWGFHGLWMSFASLMTAGFLSPIPLIVSLIGLRRPGKKMATLGMLTSLGGVALASVIVLGALAAKHQIVQQRMEKTVSRQVAETKSLLATAAGEIVEFRDHHAGQLPDEIDANMLVIKHVDPFGESLRFDAELGHGIVRSAGSDRKFDSADDVTVRVNGTTDRKKGLPVTGDRE
jgi:hypothetical protein